MFGGGGFDLRQSSVRRSMILNQPATGRSFISTALVNDSLAYGDDLRKSRIQNLPNYKKSNLGENVSFIVVFQTIEIERLSNEIELLRVKLKEAERQLFNAANYEIQIKELTEKVFNYENQLQDYRDQYEKLNKICETLYHENESLKNQLNEIDFSLKQKYESEKQKNQDLLQQIQKWKNRYQAAEKSKAKELEDLRSMMESQRKSMIDRQIREMAIRFQNERAGLEGQIRKLRQILNNRDSDIENYKQRCQKYEIELMEARNNENVIADLENKVTLLASELNRLNQLLRSRQEDIQAYKRREYELNLKIKEQQDWEADNQNIRQQLEAKVRQIEEWKLRCSKLDEEATRGKEMVHYNHELTDKLDLATKELDRLNNLLRSKIDEIQKWKQRYSAKEAELGQYKNLENDVAQYENKLNMSKAENDRVNSILKSRLEEIEAWKRKNGELEGAISRLGMLEKDKKMFEDKFNHQIKTIEELNFALNQLRSQNEGLKKAQQKCRDMDTKNDGLGREIDRLNQILRGKDQEVNDYRVRMSKLEDQMSEYKNVDVYLKDMENKIALMTQQNDRLNNLIKNKNDDLQQLEREKIELYSQVNKYKNYEPKMQQNEQVISQLKNAINKVNSDLENVNGKLRAAENKNKDLENNLYSQSQEKEKINSIARTKTQEADELKNRYSQMQNELRKLPELENVCEQLHRQSLQHLSDAENAERRNRQLETLMQREKSQNQDLKNKLNSAVSELEKLTNDARREDGRKSKEFNELQDHYSKLISKVKSKDNQIEMLVSKINQLEGQCANLMKEFNRLLEACQKSIEETNVLNKRIEEYQDYAKRIHILGAEMDRLNQINKGLEEDNKTMRLKYANNINFEKKEQELNLAKILMALEIESLRSQIQKRQLTEEDMRKSYMAQIRRV